MLSKGQMINNRYEIIKTIGEGGMANVYLAKDSILERNVAIKVLRGDLANDEKFIRRFQREAKSVSDLSHPNIVEVYDVGEEDGKHYIVMEYIEGKTLKQLIQKRGSLTLPEVVDIMCQLTDGLAHAHSAYIIHRDIKPQNILILDNGIVKITDFGIATATNATQLTQTNSVMGSVHYLAPEQANGKGSTIKSDIYSLGILMYELITGSVPFKGESAVEIALKQMKEKLPSIRKQNPVVLQSVENIVLKATAKNPRNRYDNVNEMHKDLEECLNKENEKRYVYEYPENDLDDTKIMKPVKASKEVNIPKNIDIEKEEQEDKPVKKKMDKKKKIIIILSSIALGLLIIGSIIWLVVSNSNNKEIKVPNVVEKDIDDAVYKLEELGFKCKKVSQESDKIEKDLVIKTSPKAGSKRKKGSTITVYYSTGVEGYVLEDFTDQDYKEVKAKLELLEINVLVESKEVDDPEKYKDNEDVIIDQNPKYDPKEEVTLTKGDTITLYIPNIVEKYPDIVGEGWTLSDTKAFADEYNVSLSVTFVDQNGKSLSIKDDGSHDSELVIYKNRPAGDTIVEGITLQVKVKIEVEEKKEPAKNDDKKEDTNQDDTQTQTDDTTTN